MSKEYDGEDGFCGPPHEAEEELPYLVCVIGLPDGMYCKADVIDITEEGIIFEVDPYYVEKGFVTECYLDSRYFKELGFRYYIVPHFMPTEH